MSTIDEILAYEPSDDTPTYPEIVQHSPAQELINEHRDPNLTRILDPELQLIVDELTHIATANIADVYESYTSLESQALDPATNEPIFEPITRLKIKDLTALPRSLSGAIQSVRIDGDKVEIKMYNKLDAQDKLMKHYGGYAKENEQKAQAHEKLLDMLFLGAEANGLPTPKTNDA